VSNIGFRLFGLLALAGGELAQPSAASAQAPPPSATAARASLGPTDFLSAALQVVGAIDQYDMATIWDMSSQIMKTSIPKERFIANTAQKRASLGGVQSRDWNAIMKVVIAQKQGNPLPPGRYMSVRFTTVGRNGSALEEIISFHLDQDGQWRLAGYTVQ